MITKTFNTLLKGTKLGFGKQGHMGDQKRVYRNQAARPVKHLHGEHLGVTASKHVDHPAAFHRFRAIVSGNFDVLPFLGKLLFQLLPNDLMIFLIFHTISAPSCSFFMISSLLPLFRSRDRNASSCR